MKQQSDNNQISDRFGDRDREATSTNVRAKITQYEEMMANRVKETGQ